MRQQTRKERYAAKSLNAITLPCAIATVNFMFEDNIAFVIRSAACFGIKTIYVIGSMPARGIVNPKSGSTYDEVELIYFKNPNEFLDYCRAHKLNLVSAELDDSAKNIHEYSFDFEKKNVIVLGHEEVGIPNEILFNSEKVYVPMPGTGFCLNTSQTGTTFMYEFSRQYLNR